MTNWKKYLHVTSQRANFPDTQSFSKIEKMNNPVEKWAHRKAYTNDSKKKKSKSKLHGNTIFLLLELRRS